MGNLKAKYDQIISERKDKIEKNNILEKDEKVKQYLLLCKQNKKLANEQADLYKQMKIEEYSSCNHIWVNTLQSYDSFEGRSCDYYGCVKCGLDKRVFYLKEKRHYLDLLTLDERIKESKPDIDDETAVHYFKIALNGIRNNLSPSRKVSLAKRLLLKSDYNRWNASDVRG